MSSLRTKLWSTVAIAVAVLVAVTVTVGLNAPAQAATARTVSLSATPTAEYGGKPVTLSGKVTKSPKGSIVKIQRKSGTSWVAAGQTRTTTAAGAFSVKVTLPSQPAVYAYRALAPKTRTLAGAYSRTVAVAALRKTTATLGANPAVISAGQTSTLSGNVSPYVPGTTVTVQRLSGSSWVLAGSGAISSGGGYSVNVTPATTTSYRALVPRKGLNAGTISPTRLVQVSSATAPTITTTSLPDGDKGVAYSTTLTHTGGAGTWSIVGGSLKPGLSLATNTGVISGTPTGSGTSSIIFRFTETSSGLTATKTLSMTLSPSPSITTTTLPDATRGAPYTATLAKSGKAGTWSIQNLPAGLTINAGTGVISGTTYAATGDYGVYPTFTETSTGRAVLKALALHVGGVPLAITTDAHLPDGHRDGAYSVTFTKVGGPGTWAPVQIPDGFALDANTGTLTGTPTVAGIYAVYVSFTETAGGSVTKGFSLKVVQPKITTTSVPDGVTGTAYSFQFAKTGLEGTWEANGLLPDGFALSASGLLTGNPATTGDFGFQVIFTETSTGAFSKNAFLLHIAAPGSPTITTTSLPAGTIGTPYSATLAATPTGGLWSITSGSLPVGLSLNATTGAITGTPGFAEDSHFIVTYTKGATKNTKVLGILIPPAA